MATRHANHQPNSLRDQVEAGIPLSQVPSRGLPDIFSVFVALIMGAVLVIDLSALVLN